MYQGKVELTPNDIYKKEFKVDTMGYNPKEVDKYLDICIKDYTTMINMINNLQDENSSLQDENLELKQEIRNLKMKLDALKDKNGKEVSNADVLRRLSNLEKIIYGKK